MKPFMHNAKSFKAFSEINSTRILSIKISKSHFKFLLNAFLARSIHCSVSSMINHLATDQINIKILNIVFFLKISDHFETINLKLHFKCDLVSSSLEKTKKNSIFVFKDFI